MNTKEVGKIQKAKVRNSVLFASILASLAFICFGIWLKFSGIAWLQGFPAAQRPVAFIGICSVGIVLVLTCLWLERKINKG